MSFQCCSMKCVACHGNFVWTVIFWILHLRRDLHCSYQSARADESAMAAARSCCSPPAGCILAQLGPLLLLLPCMLQAMSLSSLSRSVSLRPCSRAGRPCTGSKLSMMAFQD